ncbi:MAG: hypothetical protein IJR97_07620 [Clostridia bacterium]|nr:hypothetical protein [Clostridia bacterium]
MLDQEDKRRLSADLYRVERQNRLRTAAGVVDYFVMLLGIACILICVALIISLGNWLYQDIMNNFAIILHHLR